MEVMIPVQNTPLGGIPMKQVASYEQTGWDVDGNVRSWWTVLYFNLRNILPKSGTFPLGHPVYIYYYYRYSALGPVWAETRAQSVDWYSSGMLHPGQVLRGSLPLLSPVYIYIYIYIDPCWEMCRSVDVNDATDMTWVLNRHYCPWRLSAMLFLSGSRLRVS